MRTSTTLFFFSVLLVVGFLSKTSADVPQRFGHSSIVLNNGTIVVFGGHNFIDIDHTGKQFVGLKNDIWAINPKINGTWQEIQVSKVSPQPEPRMYHTATHKLDPTDNVTEIMVIFGGTVFLRYSGLRSTVFKCCGWEDIWEFNFRTSDWTEVVPHSGHCNAGTVVGRNYGLFVLVVLIWSFFM